MRKFLLAIIIMLLAPMYLSAARLEDVESESDGFINSPRWNGYYRIKYCIYNITEMP